VKDASIEGAETTPAGPAIRVRQLRSILAHVGKLPESACSAILADLGPEALAQIEGAASSDWLAFAVDLDLTHAIGRTLDPAGQHRFFREHQLAAFHGPLFRALVDSASAIFGLDPGSWARWIPRGWGIVFRECGQWVVDRAERGAVDLALIAPPPGCLDDEVWLRSLASSFSAFLVLTRREGEFELSRVDRGRDAACYTLRWRQG
jgi:hypothetical protein